jgi:prepilin-type N-terminal cleavage/methylation domain-containing protein
VFVKSQREAFTLIELLTVIAIIAVQGAILIPVVGNMRKNARDNGSTHIWRALFTAMFSGCLTCQASKHLR